MTVRPAGATAGQAGTRRRTLAPGVPTVPRVVGATRAWTTSPPACDAAGRAAQGACGGGQKRTPRTSSSGWFYTWQGANPRRAGSDLTQLPTPVVGQPGRCADMPPSSPGEGSASRSPAKESPSASCFGTSGVVRQKIPSRPLSRQPLYTEDPAWRSCLFSRGLVRTDWRCSAVWRRARRLPGWLPPGPSKVIPRWRGRLNDTGSSGRSREAASG